MIIRKVWALALNYFLLVTAILIGNVSLFAQDYTVSGQVIDAQSSETLISASVVAMSLKDSLIAGFAITDADGVFSIANIASESIELQITYLGYEQYKKSITLSDLVPDLDMGVLKIAPKSEMIDGVTIEEERVPIIIKKDTIIYNADAFKTQENDSVEDLLKKMPGIEVEDDGTIKAQGEEVQQVLVDGKDFFGQDAKIATQNLPAKAIDKVQVYDRKSDIAEFSGIDDGERSKTINLELKEDYKKGYFGKVNAGYGTDNRYLAGANVNRFDKKSQISVIGNLNNINQQGFNMGDYVSFMGGISGLSRGGRRGISDANINQGTSDGFVNTASGGLNYNYEFNDKTELRSSYFINKIKSTNDQYRERENFLQRGNYFNIDTTSQVSYNTNHRVNLELRHEIDTSSDLRLRSTLSFSDTEVISQSLNDVISGDGTPQNTSALDLATNGQNANLSGSILYRKKFGESQQRVFTLESSLNDTSTDREQSTESNNIFYETATTAALEQLIVQDQIQNNDNGNYSIRSTYTEPLGNGHYLDINYRHQNYDTDVMQDVFDIIDGTTTINEQLTNRYHRDYIYNRIGTGWSVNREKFSFNADLAYQKSDLNGELFTTDQIITKDFNNVLPSMNLRYDLGGTKNISLRYSTSVSEPSLEQLQPLVDNSDPLNIYIGNPNLQAEYRHQLRVRFMNFDQFNFTNFFAFMTATFTKNKIINQKLVDERFVETTTPINVDNYFNLTSYLNYGSPIRPLGIKFNTNVNLGYTRSILFLNLSENVNNRYSSGAELRVENRDKEKFDLQAGASLDYTLSKYSVNTDSNQDFLNRAYFAEFGYTGIKNWYFNTSMDYRIFANNDIGEDQRIPIWKASISRYIMNDQRVEIKFQVFDLLNQNKGISYNTNLNYTEYQRVESLGRYFLLSFTYSLKAFGGGNTDSSSRGGRMMR